MGLWEKMKEKMKGAPSIELLCEDVPKHMERQFGNGARDVYHELVSDIVHIDLHWIPANKQNPYNVAYTTGMASKAMRGEPKFAEMMVILPAHWPGPGDPGSNVDENWWPYSMLRLMARLPHGMRFCMSQFVSVPFADPPVPAPGTPFECVMTMKPTWIAPGFDTVHLSNGQTVQLYCICPLTRAETEFKIRQPKGDALWCKLRADGVQPMDLAVVNPERRSYI